MIRFFGDAPEIGIAAPRFKPAGRLLVSSQSHTENRDTLFLELL